MNISRQKLPCHSAACLLAHACLFTFQHTAMIHRNQNLRFCKFFPFCRFPCILKERKTFLFTWTLHFCWQTKLPSSPLPLLPLSLGLQVGQKLRRHAGIRLSQAVYAATFAWSCCYFWAHSAMSPSAASLYCTVYSVHILHFVHVAAAPEWVQ